MYSLRQAEILLGISRSSLQRWIKECGIKTKTIKSDRTRHYLSDKDFALLSQKKIKMRSGALSLNDANEQILSIKDACLYLHISRTTLREWLSQIECKPDCIMTDKRRRYIPYKVVLSLSQKYQYKLPKQVEEKMYSTSDVALLLNISKNTACNWMSQDKVEKTRIITDRQRVYISHSSLIALAEKHNREIYWSSHKLARGGVATPIYKAHASGMKLMAWSPDGRRIAYGCSDGTVQVWDTTNRGVLSIYKGHAPGPVEAIAWSPDSKRMASAGHDATVHVWDVTSGNQAIANTNYTYKGHAASVRALAWSPDSKRVASAGHDATVHIWDALDGAHPSLYLGHAASVKMLAWSPNGRLIASADNDDILLVWHTPSIN